MNTAKRRSFSTNLKLNDIDMYNIANAIENRDKHLKKYKTFVFSGLIIFHYYNVHGAEIIQS